MPKKTAKPPWLALAASLMALVWAAYIASSHTIAGTELSVFRYINNWPGSLRATFLIVTFFGSAWMLFAVTLLCLLRRQNRLALRVFAVGSTAFFTTEVLKHIIARPRPAVLISSIHLREALPLGYGFPSAHTAVATAVSLVFMLVLPKKWRPVAALLVILVGLSRVYLGVHAPLDVVGGFAVGLIVVCLNAAIRNKLRFVTKITHMKLTD